MNKNKQTGYGHKYRAVAAVLTLCIISSLLAGCSKEKQEESSQTDSVLENTIASMPEETTPELSVTDLLKAVVTLKSDLEAALDDIKSNDLDHAQTMIEAVSAKTDVIQSSLRVTMENLGDTLPSMQAQLKNIQALLELEDAAIEKIIKPFIQQLRAHPVSEMREGDGIRVAPLGNYIDFLESIMPDVELLIGQASDVDLSLVDSDGKLAGYLETANELLEMYQKDNSIFARLKDMFGINGDRLYVVAAQNSAEIRASGGFPGAVGTMRIQNGVLVLDDFRGVNKLLATYTPAEANITNKENQLFHGGLSVPRDADFCPDNERVAYIWALGYEAKQKEHVDGVISMTPNMVQKILAAVDEEIKLFDGTVLTGENAVKVLQHDLYFKYFGRDYIQSRNVVSDQLFADAAKKTMQKLMENFEISDIMEYVSIARDSFKDRTLMLWMADETMQAMLAKLGWSGGLNSDPEKPQAGVYYNCTIASKMGWFLIMDTEIGDRVKNEDGSYTYPITVTFSNDITKEEIQSASSYITGGNSGAIGGSAYFFAPAGGSVSDFVTSNQVSIEHTTYHDLELGYMRIFNIYPNKPVTVTYKVTTAPGVETPLTFSKTPTVQEYH